jgi:hypothetical protein
MLRLIDDQHQRLVQRLAQSSEERGEHGILALVLNAVPHVSGYVVS